MQIVTAYHQYTDKADVYINRNITRIPKGFVHAHLKQFAISFATATMLSKENRLVSGLKNGTLNFLTMIINFCALKQIKSYCDKNSIKFDLNIVSFVLKEMIFCLLNRKNPLEHAKVAALSFMLQQASNRISM